jgi:hypothetical protein
MMVVQAKPLLESEDNKVSKNKQQLYEIYKTMRADPHLASVSNNDLVFYIYRYLFYRKNEDTGSMKSKSPNQQLKTE